MERQGEGFIRDEDGAISVDWVVITAGLVVLTLAVMAIAGGSTRDVSQKMSGDIANRPTTVATTN